MSFFATERLYLCQPKLDIYLIKFINIREVLQPMGAELGIIYFYTLLHFLVGMVYLYILMLFSTATAYRTIYYYTALNIYT